MELMQRLEEYRERERGLTWEGTFRDYLEVVRKKPKVSQLSHARIYEMVMAGGVEVLEGGERQYELFVQDLFGLEPTVQQIVDYFAAASRRLEVRKRILLLVGPVGSGKSTTAEILKRGLESFSRTEEGTVYAIKGCPMQEEPLHLIPRPLRPDFQKEYGVYIEGDLCPRCQYALEKEHGWDFLAMPVQRFGFSESAGIGIGTFVATDPLSQDLGRLVGHVDPTVEEGRDPRAYRLDGEFNVANRGLMEFIEMLKADEKFLAVLLMLTQEQKIKTGRFGSIYADECIISHTNEQEYNSFVANRKAEALQDRLIVVRVPYTLRVQAEMKIYQKLLKESALEDRHIAPHTLRVASTFAVLSRLEPSQRWGLDLVKKLKLYDGQYVEGYTPGQIQELREETPREGMGGVGPRYVLNQIASTVVKDDGRCITPLEALRALRDGFEQHPSLAQAERQSLLDLIAEARKVYDDLAMTDLQRALVPAFRGKAQDLLNSYLKNVEAYLEGKKVQHPISGEEMEPDDKAMRSVEEPIQVQEHSQKAFRKEVWDFFSSLKAKGQPWEYDSHLRLKEGIETRLLPSSKEVAKVLLDGPRSDPEVTRLREEVVGRLIAEQGYCENCARELLSYLGGLVQETGAYFQPRRKRWWRF